MAINHVYSIEEEMAYFEKTKDLPYGDMKAYVTEALEGVMREKLFPIVFHAHITGRADYIEALATGFGEAMAAVLKTGEMPDHIEEFIPLSIAAFSKAIKEE